MLGRGLARAGASGTSGATGWGGEWRWYRHMVNKPGVSKLGPLMVLKYVPRCEWVPESLRVNQGFWLSHSPISWAALSLHSGCGKPMSKRDGDQKGLLEGLVSSRSQTGGQIQIWLFKM